MVHLNGFLGYPTSPYTVPYGVIVPKEIDNLLFPVPISGSHIGFSTLRMEPCWMAMGQAAGIAASLSIEERMKVQNIDMKKLQSILINQKATLVYFEDVDTDNPDFAIVQKMALRGYLPDWKARINETVDKNTLAQWERLSGISLKELQNKTRLEVLKYIHSKVK